jgi:L-ascorbate metabolism protein UlaG (beta-lactamase superfamily)
MSFAVQATAVLVTHEHPDHLDSAAIKWIKSVDLPVWASSIDVPSLQRKKLNAHAVEDGIPDFMTEVIPGSHGRGVIGWMMGPVSGFFLAHPGEPSIYITSDTVLTNEVSSALVRLKPDVVVAPAGVANFGIGPDILFSLSELVTLVRRAPGKVVLNHMEALDHCPVRRTTVRKRMEEEGLTEKVLIPDDGEELDLQAPTELPTIKPQPSPHRRPTLQKWLTSKFSGT